MRPLRLVTLISSALAIAAPAIAQQAQRSGFVTVAPFADFDHSLQFECCVERSGEWGVGVGGAIGGFISPGRSIRLEVQVPGPASSTYTWEISSNTTTRRDVVIAGLLGLHGRSARRVKTTFLLGGGLAHAELSGTSSTRTRENLGLMFGTDVEVQMTRALQLLPQVRVTLSMGDDSAIIVRLGCGLGWSF